MPIHSYSEPLPLILHRSFSYNPVSGTACRVNVRKMIKSIVQKDIYNIPYFHFYEQLILPDS
jgi:hypothetical protein